MEKLTKEMWDSMGLKQSAASGAFDVMTDLTAALRETYPDFDFGFFSAKSMGGRVHDGWVLMKPEWFNLEGYKAQVPMRFGLEEKEGALWWHDLMLFVMPTERHRMIEEALNEESERRFNEVVRGVAESKHAGTSVSEATESSYEEKQVTIRDPEVQQDLPVEQEATPQPQKRGPGRPRKNP